MVASRSRLRAACSPAILVTGAIGYGGSVLLQNLGIERTSVTHAALLIGATPVMVAIIATVLRHSVARPLAWAGFALSLAGVAFIAGGQGSGSGLAGDALVLAAQVISAGFTVSQARLLRGRDPIAVTGLQLMAAAVAVLPVAVITEHHVAGPVSMLALLATIGLVLAGTVLPTSLFAFGQSRVTADVAGAFLNLEPLVGAIMGMALFAEPAGLAQIAGGAAIMIGIGLSSFQVVRLEQRRRAARPVLRLPRVLSRRPCRGRLGCSRLESRRRASDRLGSHRLESRRRASDRRGPRRPERPHQRGRSWRCSPARGRHPARRRVWSGVGGIRSRGTRDSSGPARQIRPGGTACPRLGPQALAPQATGAASNWAACHRVAAAGSRRRAASGARTAPDGLSVTRHDGFGDNPVRICALWGQRNHQGLRERLPTARSRPAGSR